MFYVLEISPVDRVRGETDFSSVEPLNLGEAPTCEACGSFVGMLSWLPPYRVELELWDKQFGDISEGGGNDLLVSERFKILYEESGLKGLEGFDPVEVVRVKRHKRFKGQPPNYFRVKPKRTNAGIDLIKSGFEGDAPLKCPGCLDIGLLKRAKRIIIEPSSWTGEDLFIARGLPGRIIASERFKDFYERYKITGALLIEAEKYSFDFYPLEKRASPTGSSSKP